MPEPDIYSNVTGSNAESRRIADQLEQQTRDLMASGRGQTTGALTGQTQQSSTGANYPYSMTTQQQPSGVEGMLMKMIDPTMGVAGKLMHQVKYGMNDESAANYARLAAEAGNAGLSQAELVQMARQQYKDSANVGGGLTTSNGSPVTTGSGGAISTGGASVPSGPADSGTFKPVTFRPATDTEGTGTEGTGTEGTGSDLMGRAEGMLGEPEEFNYNFDPAQRSQELFDQRSALLQPAFAQQRAQLQEGMFGSGRLGLRLAGEGAGAGSGMVQPDVFGLGQAQSQALADLAARSSTDAFGESMQRAGLDLSKFMTNQGTQQQLFGNLTGLEALRQNYELALRGADLQDRTFERGGETESPWWDVGTGLASSFLGTNAGSNWLSKGFGKGGWFS